MEDALGEEKRCQKHTLPRQGGGGLSVDALHLPHYVREVSVDVGRQRIAGFWIPNSHCID